MFLSAVSTLRSPKRADNNVPGLIRRDERGQESLRYPVVSLGDFLEARTLSIVSIGETGRLPYSWR